MRVPSRHHDVLHWAMQFSGDLFRGGLPDSFGKPALVRADQGGTCRAVIEYDGTHVKLFVRILARWPVGWVRRRSNVYARRSGTQCPLRANRGPPTERTYKLNQQIQRSPLAHISSSSVLTNTLPPRRSSRAAPFT